MALTEFDIHHAAEALFAEGVPLPRISSRAVRDRLGRGSLGTIVPALRRWKEGRASAAPVVPDVLPPEIGEALDRVLQSIGPRFWSASQAWHTAIIEKRLAALSEDLGVQAVELESEIQRVEGVNIERGDTIARQSIELTQAREEIARLERDLAAQMERTAAAERVAADAEKAHREAAAARAHREALEIQLRDAKAELDKVRADERQARDEAASLRGQHALQG